MTDSNGEELDFNKIKSYWKDPDQQALVLYMLIKEINELKQEAKKANKIISGLSAWSLVMRQLLIIIPVLITLLTLFLNFWGK